MPEETGKQMSMAILIASHQMPICPANSVSSVNFVSGEQHIHIIALCEEEHRDYLTDKKDVGSLMTALYTLTVKEIDSLIM